ncbi:hypothetical protein EG68_00369 [Paragonimus skrjabini miyazakii]|uniref:Uncharacterized protein n=1 Tax=Paragonimus skrjabini miyazakii TaxID=59628 RepID=A0A8S9ZCE3_9TREM|nr:hypothetical protein EG68_00369 [Paragonimus skrjabini miyazakii]
MSRHVQLPKLWAGDRQLLVEVKLSQVVRRTVLQTESVSSEFIKIRSIGMSVNFSTPSSRVVLERELVLPKIHDWSIQCPLFLARNLSGGLSKLQKISNSVDKVKVYRDSSGKLKECGVIYANDNDDRDKQTTIKRLLTFTSLQLVTSKLKIKLN